MSTQLDQLSTTFSILAANTFAAGDTNGSNDNAHFVRHYRDEYCRLAGMGTTRNPNSGGVGPLVTLDQFGSVVASGSTVNLVYSSSLKQLVYSSLPFFGL